MLYAFQCSVQVKKWFAIRDHFLLNINTFQIASE